VVLFRVSCGKQRTHSGYKNTTLSVLIVQNYWTLNSYKDIDYDQWGNVDYEHSKVGAAVNSIELETISDPVIKGADLDEWIIGWVKSQRDSVQVPGETLKVRQADFEYYLDTSNLKKTTREKTSFEIGIRLDTRYVYDDFGTLTSKTDESPTETDSPGATLKERYRYEIEWWPQSNCIIDVNRLQKPTAQSQRSVSTLSMF